VLTEIDISVRVLNLAVMGSYSLLEFSSKDKTTDMNQLGSAIHAIIFK